jgi:hypothetical protein
MPGDKGVPDPRITWPVSPAAVIVATLDRLVPASRRLKRSRAGLSTRVGANHAVCIAVPQLSVRALPWDCWPAQPGHVQLAAPGRRQRLTPRSLLADEPP